jgi:hypothetical protein
MRNFPSVLTKKLFSSFLGAILITISEINYRAMHWPELRPQTRVSGFQLKLTNAMRVVTQDFGRKSKLKFLVVNQVLCMSIWS